MEKHIVRIISIENVTHDVLQIVTEKPEKYTFTPGQATEVSINKNEWKDKKNPFTFTSLPDDRFLEFTIKTYPVHKSVTNEMLQLRINDELILHEVFGAISYKGEGVFIAGGAGITPFISIFRDLLSRKEIGNNKLIFANKNEQDIINKDEFEKILGSNFINILSDEDVDGYAHGQITTDFIEANVCGIYDRYYLCGPPPMMESVEKQLIGLHVDKEAIIKEAF